jgi:hypothetical protein
VVTFLGRSRQSTNAWLALPGMVVVGAAVVVGAPVVVGAAVLVVGVTVVVVLPPLQAFVHASQQLVVAPRHAAPPFGGRHLSALLLVEHRTLPRRSTRQQVTASGLPHVDFAAQRTTSPLHSVGSWPFDARVFARSPTHFTYCPWLSAVAQLHCAAAAVRAAATAAVSSHRFADAIPGMVANKATASMPFTNDLIARPPLGPRPSQPMRPA